MCLYYIYKVRYTEVRIYVFTDICSYDNESVNRYTYVKSAVRRAMPKDQVQQLNSFAKKIDWFYRVCLYVALRNDTN